MRFGTSDSKAPRRRSQSEPRRSAALDRLCADLQEAVDAVPRLTGRPPRPRGRFTVYVYDEGPLSEADWSGPKVRFDFYFSSWSFVDFLLGRGGMEKLWPVVDAGGAPAAYQAAYGLSRDELLAAWTAGLAGPAAP